MAAKTLQPMRYSMRTAAEVLNVSPHQVRVLAKSGVLTPIYPAGQGRGKKTYVLPGEVQAYARGGLAGVVAYREKQARKRK
jgi:hypothetical protein